MSLHIPFLVSPKLTTKSSLTFRNDTFWSMLDFILPKVYVVDNQGHGIWQNWLKTKG